VAGETLDDAINVTRTLNEKGLLVSLDFLGESVTKAEDTEEVVATYTQLIQRINDENLKASVSLKLTHMGLDISEELCLSNLRNILAEAKKHSILVTIDMESSGYIDTTLRIYRAMYDSGFDNVGTVIQSMMRRSGEDMKQLAQEGARIRLCKGAYLEAPEIAFPDKADVDAHYIQITQDYLKAAAPAMLEVATHDDAMIDATLKAVAEINLPPERYEIQMLYGIRPAKQAELAADGHHMRVYVPFGGSWYPYLMRRMAERPANLIFILKNLFRR
jgi:proline dehydrogenase